MDVVKPITRKQYDQWIDALRSGKYKKGLNRLHDTFNDSYCCLGVANELFDFGFAPDKGHLGNGLIYKFLAYKAQHMITKKNDISKTFEPVIELLEEMVSDGRITFAEETE